MTSMVTLQLLASLLRDETIVEVSNNNCDGFGFE